MTEREIFDAALEIRDDESRADFLRRSCGSDARLLGHLEGLLRARQQVGNFLESGAPGVVAMTAMLPDDPPLAEPVGAMIGPYKLRELLGEGGMGSVYVAEQERPLRRKVALKVVKPGMDTREVIGRFEAERQALALMDHPTIAKVYDAGTTETGRPYFVMELVRGMPITEYCDRRRLPPRERIKLFITVCQAIQHAHQRGIIHRDLKPSNVMITLHDGVPVPKVIDFGVAKAINQKLTEHTLYTRHAQLVGTPLYMSPEQAELSGLEIDTRSDVYSLGVLLYELLTGHTPFDKEMFSKIGYDEMRRMIREDEPPRPSQRISTLAAEARSTVSSQRGTDDRQLARVLHGELDWIVMKALEKDRTRRYGGPDALAADLQCYLEDQPIQACPPSVGYRVRKFIRRKTRSMGATTVLIAAMALTVGGPLAAYGVFKLIQGPDPATGESVSREGVSQTAEPAKSRSSPRAPGRELPGLVPEPLLIPEVGRWQLITKKPRGMLRSGVWSPDETLIALGEANHVRIYDATNLQLLHVLVAHSQPVRSVAWHPDGKRIASASEDGTVRLWTSDGTPTHLLDGHSGPVYKVAWRPDGKQLASASADGTVRLWNADGTAIRTLDESDRHVFGINWRPDGKQLASVGGDIRNPDPEGNPGDNAVRLYDAETGTRIHAFGGSEKHSALCVAWRPDGKQLAVGYGDVYHSIQGKDAYRSVSDAGIRLWEPDGSRGPEIAGEFGTINAIAWDSEGRRLAFGGRIGAVHIWDAVDQVLIDSQPAPVRDLSCISWKRDGSRMLTTRRASLSEWDPTGRTSGVILEGLCELNFRPVKWSPDGKILASSGMFWNADGSPSTPPDRPTDGAPPWWENETKDRRPDGSRGPSLEGYVPTAKEYAWNKQGWLASATWEDAAVRIWNESGKLIAICKGHRGGVASVSWSPKGDWLASGGGDSVRLWKQDGMAGPVMTGHTDEVLPVAWSPDGRWIASAGADATIRLWKPDGAAGPVLKGHQGGLVNVAWSPDSKRLVSGGYRDSTLRVWNVETGKTEWQALRLESDAAVTLSPSGQLLHGDRGPMESGLLYLIEKPNDATDVLTFGDFWKRNATPFLKHEMGSILHLVQAGKLQDAVVAFDRVTAIDVEHKLTWDGAIGDSFLEHHLYAQAVPVFSSIINHGSPSWHIIKRRGAAYMGLKEYDKALADISTAVQMNPSDATNFTWFPQSILWESPPEIQEAFLKLATKAIDLSPENYSVRSSYYLHRGDYDNALADINQWIAASSSPNATSHYLRALLLVTRQDIEGYRRGCKEMLERFGDTRDAEEARWVVWSCALAADAAPDYEIPLRLAVNAVEQHPDQTKYLNGLGAVLYRAGRHQEAVARLTEENLLWSDTPRDDVSTRAYTWYFLAMAELHLGHASEASVWLRKADEWSDQILNNEQEPPQWNRKLTLELLRREAHSLIDSAARSEPAAAVPLPER